MFKYEVITNEDIKQPRFFYLVESKKFFKTKEGLLHLFTVVNRRTLTVPKEVFGKEFIKVVGYKDEIDILVSYPTIFLTLEKVRDLEKTDPVASNFVYGVIRVTETDAMLIKLCAGDIAPFHPFDQFLLTPGMIDNYLVGEPIVTDVGKFLVNHVLFADIVKDLVPYQNKKLSPGKTDNFIANLLIENKIGREEYTRYVNQGYWLLENGTIFVGAFTKRSLTTGDEVLAKKKELFAKYKDQMNDPTVLAKIESELIAMDKAYIKGDSSEIFFEACGGKSYGEARKKMFLLFGMSNTIDGQGFEFTPNSLEDGWEPQYLATGANEVRRGSYGRGIETAKGGAESKFILRTFQETGIKEDDCLDNRGMSISLTENNIDQYLERFLVSGDLITEENKGKYIGKTVKLRSPMTCKTKNGFCFKCCGNIFKKINLKAIGMQTLLATASFTDISMAAMHQSSVKVTEIKDINEFVVEK
jgi:hypothetical protein